MKLLMALRADEAEPVTIEVTERGRLPTSSASPAHVLTLTLDDGDSLTFDLEEFDDAIAAELKAVAEAA